jgi:hypothetical protein
LYVATFVAMSRVEVLFRQQFRRDLRAGRFTWVCPIRPWHFSASPMQATVLIPILSDINMHNAPNPHAGACQHRTWAKSSRNWSSS